MLEYQTIAGSVTYELEVTRSRFIAHLARVQSEAEAREIIAERRREHPRARHHCTAFIVGAAGELARHNDDGEPSGTAGTPIYEALNSSEVSDVVAVVTRYFGGVLLGAGGLTRAYRAATAAALAQAKIIKCQQQQRLTVVCAYEIHAVLIARAAKLGARTGDAVYTDRVAQDFWVPLALIGDLRAAIAECSAGAAEIFMGEIDFIDLTDSRAGS